jgi:glycosyltransferase involved in cell wall biosynthesis
MPPVGGDPVWCETEHRPGNRRSAKGFMTSRVVIVIPAYNEAVTVGGILARCLECVGEVVVIDDGSTDDTAAVVRNFPVELLRNDGNEGKAASLVRGMRRAVERGAEIVVTMDADGQHRPEDLSQLIGCAAAYPGRIVIGSRLHQREAFPPLRYIGNRIADFWISWACGYRVEDSQSGFRLYPSSLLAQLDVPHGPDRGFVFESEILIEAARRGVRSISVPIPALYEGTTVRASHFRPIRDVLRIVRMVAWKLISRGFYPQGLWRIMTESR